MTVDKNNPSFAGRVHGMLHGVALGDAMGAPVEKLSAANIREKYGRVETLNTSWHRDTQPESMRKGRKRGNGIVTDDTFMTLALMEIYNTTGRHLDAWDMAEGMVREITWRERWIPELQRECPLIERLFYPEKWIFQRHQLSSCDPRQGGIGNMVNCGAAMYIAPIGAVNAADPQRAYDEAINFASGHQQSYGLEAAGVLASAVAAAFQADVTIDKVVSVAHELAKDGTRSAIAAIAGAAEKLRDKGAEFDEVVDVFQREIAAFSNMGDDLNHTAERAGVASSGYQPSRFQSIEELPLALGFAIVAKGDFRQSIMNGINSGRDADSIGVMAGAILGAMHGDSVIEPEDAQLLNSANRLDIASETDSFIATAQKIIANDAAAAAYIQQQRADLLNKDT
jgi:ADP-ribosylglycohydrolase|tara:strand:+ start:232 stop:1422 length:1191 start_codon:yes stop_codon:yes gene_type:complete